MHISLGSPRMCIKISAAPHFAASTPIPGSFCSDVMSLIIEAPLSSAALATSAFDVSTEIGIGYLGPEPKDSRIGRIRAALPLCDTQRPGRSILRRYQKYRLPSCNLPGPVYVLSRVQVAAFVREGIRGDVENSHHLRSLPKVQYPVPGRQCELFSGVWINHRIYD